MKCLLSSLLCVFLTSPALATIVTADPDAFADGTDISTAFTGITLSASGTTTNSSPSVFATLAGTPSTTPLLFGHDGGSLWALDTNGGNLATMRIDFTMPTGFVSIDAISNVGDLDGDFAEMMAFDISGNPLDSDTATIPPEEIRTLSISRGSKDISYVLITNPVSQLSQSFHLDNLRYHLVPEPAGIYSVLIGSLVVCSVLRKNY